MPKLLVIRQYDCVVLTIIYYKISAPLNNRIFLEVPIRKIKRYRAYFSLDVGDKIESETLLSQNDPADILELRMLFEIAYQSLDILIFTSKHLNDIIFLIVTEKPDQITVIVCEDVMLHDGLYEQIRL